jgi:hypothetical protein
MQPLPNCTKERCHVNEFGELRVCDQLAAEIPDKVAVRHCIKDVVELMKQ